MDQRGNDVQKPEQQGLCIDFISKFNNEIGLYVTVLYCSSLSGLEMVEITACNISFEFDLWKSLGYKRLLNEWLEYP